MPCEIASGEILRLTSQSEIRRWRVEVCLILFDYILRTIDNRPYGSLNILQCRIILRHLVATSIARHKNTITQTDSRGSSGMPTPTKISLICERSELLNLSTASDPLSLPREACLL